MMLPRFYSTPTKVNYLFRYSVTGTLFLLALLVPWFAAAQPVPGDEDGDDEGVYALPIGNPTIVWAAPSTSAREIARLDSAGVPLKSLDVVDAEGKTFEKVAPRPGAGVSWTIGYVLSDQIRVNRTRPQQYGIGVYGTLAFSSTEPSTLSLEGSNGTAQNPFGEEGRSPILGAGFTFTTGKYIPPGDAGPWFRFDLEYALLQSNEDAAPNVESASANLVRVAVGGEYIYQASSSIDLYIGALIGGAPVGNTFTLDDDQTIAAEAVFGTADALVGVGYGRNVSAQGGAFSGFQARLEGGYRFGRRLGDWSFTAGDGDEDTEGEEVSGSLEAEDADQALSLSGPVLRLVVGF